MLLCHGMAVKKMRGHPWSNDICEAVICASQLGVSCTVTEAVTGLSKQSIQQIISEPEHGNDHHRRPRSDIILDAEHYHVS